MYLVGAAHPNKAGAKELLEAAIAASERLVTSAEVLQEILHRYVAIDRRDAIQPTFDALHAAVMARENIDRIMMFDTAFDRIPGMSRYRA